MYHSKAAFVEHCYLRMMDEVECGIVSFQLSLIIPRQSGCIDARAASISCFEASTAILSFAYRIIQLCYL